MRFVSLLFLCLTIGAAASKSKRPKLANISLRLYTDETTDKYTAVRVANASKLICKMDTKKPTVMYIFGWLGEPDQKSVKAIISAYLKRHDHNVILADYQEIASQSYLKASASIAGVGKTLAKVFNDLVAGGLNSSTIHVIGHSLGGQVAGYIARHLNFPLPRITGLDPAGPRFYPPHKHLSSDDALFVDVIHTDASVFGYAESVGSVNFYPNGGVRRQPGCKMKEEALKYTCSHGRSWQFYAESVLNENAFTGIKCKSYTKFKQGLCSSKKITVMGFATPRTARGNYSLQTNSESPYGRGIDGLIYKA